MPKAEMNAFDCAALVHELRSLVGARVDKVFQPTREEVLVRLRQPRARIAETEGEEAGGRGAADGEAAAAGRGAAAAEGTKRDIVAVVGKAVTLTRIPRENPTEPPSFAMQLRRQLSGARLADVRQYHFDRVVEFDFERGGDQYTLVVELFHDGNVILVKHRETAAPGEGDEGPTRAPDGASGVILAALLQQSWATRDVRPGAEFRHPPPRTRPSGLAYEDFRARVLASESDAVRTLATEFNLGGQYGEEVCARAGVPKNKATRELLEDEVRALHETLQTLVRRLEAGELEPVVVWKGDSRVDAAPWPLVEHERPGLRVERVASFAEALDQYYSKPVTVEREDPALRRFREEKGKAERQAAQQRAALLKFEQQEVEAKERGDLLYAHFQPAQDAIAYVSALGRSLGWHDGLARLEAARAEGRPEALLVESVLPKEATAVLHLEDAAGKRHKVRVDFRKNLQDNAQDYYARSKKFKEKQVGARAALARSEARLAELEKKGERILAEVERKRDAPKPTRRYWFEAYRWFRTSDGFLVLGGRDASSNEKLVKKQLEDEDRYVHADLHGAPSVVIKAAGREPTERALEEACAFAVGMSKTWAAGHAAGEAFWVLPSQVSKTPNPGEYVAKGAFIVRGKRNYRTVRVRFAVGEVEVEGQRKVMGGPDEAVAAQSKRRVVLEPGDELTNRLAPRLARAFDVPVEEIQAVLPPGGCRVVEAHGVEVG